MPAPKGALQLGTSQVCPITENVLILMEHSASFVLLLMGLKQREIFLGMKRGIFIH